MNKIHPTAIIGDNVILGENNEVGAYTVIEGPTIIGDNNIIGHHVVVGSPGENSKNPRYDSTNAQIKIGNNNIFKEFTSIQKPCYKDITRIENDVFLMHGVYVPHDAILENKVIAMPSSSIGGIAVLLEGASIGMGAKIHQYSIVGHYSFIAMGSALNKNVRPFTLYIRNQAPKVNAYAVKKFGFDDYTDQISKYVLEGVDPTIDEILKFTEEFQKLHLDSQRKLYT